MTNLRPEARTESRSSWGHKVLRVLYLLVMYSGIRAVYNRFRAGCCVKETRVEMVGDSVLASESLGVLEIVIHRRPRPKGTTSDQRFGMISLRPRRSAVNPLLYHWLLLTSHFGCGHVEIAFYEANGCVTFYGIRNILRANAERLGMRKIGTALRLAPKRESLKVICESACLLQQAGMPVRFATGQECVRLSVFAGLLNPRHWTRSVASFEEKYDRLRLQFERDMESRADRASSARLEAKTTSLPEQSCSGESRKLSSQCDSEPSDEHPAGRVGRPGVSRLERPDLIRY